MKSITLRDLPDDLSRRIQEQARLTGASLNKTVIDMLTASEPPKKRLYHDLDHLAGTWSTEEAEQFDNFLAEQRAVESDLWR